MSQQLFNMIAELRLELDKLKGAMQSLQADQARMYEGIERIENERIEIRDEVRKFEKRFAPVEAMTAAIAEDARAILGATRDRIDPTKVKMPETLKRMGYGDKS